MPEFDTGEPERSQDAASRLQLACEAAPQGVRLRLVGELDLASAPDLDRALDALATDGHDSVLIDLSGVTFMDSRGLASIARAYRHAEQSGGRVVLHRGPPQVQRLFEITATLNRFTFDDYDC